MKRFKRVVVCIDRPDQDYPMVVYAGGRSRLAMAEEVHFLHVTSEVRPDTTEGSEGASEGARLTRETLEALVAENFKGHGEEKLVCAVLCGSPLIEVLRFAHEKDIDLIILGRHYGRAGYADDEALLARRITRQKAEAHKRLAEALERKAKLQAVDQAGFAALWTKLKSKAGNWLTAFWPKK